MKEHIIAKHEAVSFKTRQEENEQRINRWFITVVLLCWAWINFWVAWRYEPWRDVAQSWMIVRQLNLSGVMAQLKYEGHPCLWFLLLMPLAKCGLPFQTIFVVSFMLTGVGIWLFMRYAPVGKLVKLAVVFSGAGMYYLPVIARSYALVPLLLMLLWLAYPRRYIRPLRYAVLLFLLCQVHVLLCGLVGVLMLLWVIGMPKAISQHTARLPYLVSALVTMVGAVGFLYWQLSGSVGINQQVSLAVISNLATLRNLYFQTVDSIGLTLANIRMIDIGNTFWRLAEVPIMMSAVAFAIIWFWRAPISAFIASGAFFWQLSIHALVYAPHMFHVITLIWMLIFCVLLAIGELQGKKECRPWIDAVIRKAFFSIIVVISIVSFVRVYPAMVLECSDKGVTSYASAAAQYINTQLPTDALVLIDDEDTATSVAAFCADGKLYNPIRHNTHIFSLHAEDSAGWCAYGDLDAEIATLRSMGINRPLYLLTDKTSESAATSMSERSDAKLALMQQFANDYALENYLLYRIEDTVGSPSE